MYRSLILSLLLSLALFSACLAEPTLPYEGRVLSVVTGFSDIARILSSHIEEFRNLTGATVVVNVRPFDTLFSDIITDLEQGSPFFDAYAKKVDNFSNFKHRFQTFPSSITTSKPENLHFTSVFSVTPFASEAKFRFHPPRFVLPPQWLADLVDCRSCQQVRTRKLGRAP
jgi:hypothetical protein